MLKPRKPTLNEDYSHCAVLNPFMELVGVSAVSSLHSRKTIQFNLRMRLTMSEKVSHKPMIIAGKDFKQTKKHYSYAAIFQIENHSIVIHFFSLFSSFRWRSTKGTGKWVSTNKM